MGSPEHHHHKSAKPGSRYVSSLEGMSLVFLSSILCGSSLQSRTKASEQFPFFLRMRSPSHLHCMVRVLQSSGAAKLCLPSISKMETTHIAGKATIDWRYCFFCSKQYLSQCFPFFLFAEAIIRCVTLQSKRTKWIHWILRTFWKLQLAIYSKTSLLYIKMCPLNIRNLLFLGPFSRNLCKYPGLRSVFSRALCFFC